jgi:hypothetical protein
MFPISIYCAHTTVGNWRRVAKTRIRFWYLMMLEVGCRKSGTGIFERESPKRHSVIAAEFTKKESNGLNDR